MRASNPHDRSSSGSAVRAIVGGPATGRLPVGCAPRRATVRGLELVFRILGPLEAASPAGPIRLGGPRQRSVLALLLLDANRVVSIDRLADQLYGEAPPTSAVTQVHRQISELRALLEPGRPAGRGWRGDRDATARLPDPGARRMRSTSRSSSGERRPRARRSRPATPSRQSGSSARRSRLWRGEPLADLAFEPFARSVVERLSELRLTVTEQCLEAELELGRGAELVPELEQLVAEHPLNERLRGQLMIALYRAGRQPEALEVFRAGRAALVEAFGLEPTPALKELETRVLQQDPALAHGSRPRTRARLE